MKRAAILTAAAAAALLIAGSSSSKANIEAGAGDTLPAFDLANLSDRIDTIMNQITETAADVPLETAASNIGAFLALLRQSEGTANEPDPYAVCYGYKHTISDFREHPAISGEWGGEVLPDAMCANAGFGPGCKSTAAGAYQLIRPTWISLRDALGLTSFDAAAQDAAAVELIRRRAALEDVKAGRIADAVTKCRNTWASSPGNYAAQGQHSMDTLVSWYQSAGGNLA